MSRMGFVVKLGDFNEREYFERLGKFCLKLHED
jgi:hypothetical protein